MKKLIVALLGLNALLIALLTAQSVQSAPKTYDAVKMAQYTACLNAHANVEVALIEVGGGNGSLAPSKWPTYCANLKP